MQDERRRAETDFEAERRRVTSEREQEMREAADRLQAARDQATTERAAALAEARRESDAAVERAGREAAEAAARAEALRPPAADGQASAAAFDQLSTGMQAIDAAHTLSEALESLLRHAAGMASRGALFLVNGDRLRSWKTVGFPQLDAQPFDSAMSGAGLLAKAVQSGEAVASGPGLPAPTFAAVPSTAAAVAVPLLVDGRAVAVLYADTVRSDGAAVPASWRTTVEALAHHGSSVLALLTALRTVQALGVRRSGNGEADEQGARRYARLLVSEESSCTTRRPFVRDASGAICSSGCVRRSIGRGACYEERIPELAGARGQYFQQELVQTLADGDPALLGNA